jgi:hypothetical protein
VGGSGCVLVPRLLSLVCGGTPTDLPVCRACCRRSHAPPGTFFACLPCLRWGIGCVWGILLLHRQRWVEGSGGGGRVVGGAAGFVALGPLCRFPAGGWGRLVAPGRVQHTLWSTPRTPLYVSRSGVGRPAPGSGAGRCGTPAPCDAGLGPSAVVTDHHLLHPPGAYFNETQLHPSLLLSYRAFVDPVSDVLTVDFVAVYDGVDRWWVALLGLHGGKLGRGRCCVCERHPTQGTSPPAYHPHPTPHCSLALRNRCVVCTCACVFDARPRNTHWVMCCGEPGLRWATRQTSWPWWARSRPGPTPSCAAPPRCVWPRPRAPCARRRVFPSLLRFSPHRKALCPPHPPPRATRPPCPQPRPPSPSPV